MIRDQMLPAAIMPATANKGQPVNAATQRPERAAVNALGEWAEVGIAINLARSARRKAEP